MRHIESAHQRAVIDWARRHPLARRMYAVPNGGKRSAFEAARLKGEGVRAGVPDLCLNLPRGGAHGLFVEMKAPGGRESPEQKLVMEELVEEGYCVIVAHDALLAIEAIRAYLDGQLPPGKHLRKPSAGAPRKAA